MLRLVFLGKFGSLAPATLEAAEPPASVATLKDLRDWVGDQAPALGAALATGPFKMILNREVVHDMSVGFGAGDEIAFMPPMSGG
jgi:molybdopterin converting factor small subunit